MRVSQVVKGEMSAKTTYQKSAKGPVSIAECAADGKSVTLENVGRKVRLRRTYLILPLFANMWQGLCNGMLSVRLSARLSVPSIDRCSSVRQVCCCGPGGQEIAIDCCTAGAQQQLRAVSRCQLTCEAEH